MDKLYKLHLIRQVKAGMAARWPAFVPHRVPTDHPLRDIFSGVLLYRAPSPGGRTVWLSWRPGPGVERDFDVRLGWSPGPEVLPSPERHERELFNLRGPSPAFPAASLSLQQIRGEAAIGGYRISTPWDRLLDVKVSAPRAVQADAMRRAHEEAQALTEEDRASAVRSTLELVFEQLDAELPRFVEALRQADAAG